MKNIRKRSIYLLLASSLLLAGCRTMGESEQITSISIVDRNGVSETISSKDRLDAYQNTDFLTPQPYQKVLRVYGRDKKGDIHSQITSYHPNGELKQLLEACNNRANGSYREWHPNGQLKLEANVIGGIADINNQAEQSWLFEGLNRVWDEEAHLIAEILYSKGELQGESKYYHANGNIWKLANYQNNFPNGEHKIFLENGNLLQVTEFVKGIKKGTSIRYWHSGQVAHEESYDEGRLMQARYMDKEGNVISQIVNGNGFKALFSKDKLQELHEHKNGISEGLVKIFNEDSQLVRLFSLKEGEKNGEEIDYYPKKNAQSLQPKILITWQNGIIQGPIKTWHENGNPESLREMSQNKKSGLFTAWYKNGSLMFVEEYDNDKLVKGEYYRINEKTPLSKVNKGLGIAMLHNDEGHLTKKIYYRNGKPEDDAAE